MLSAEYDVTTRMSSKNSISPLKKGLIKPTDIENSALRHSFFTFLKSLPEWTMTVFSDDPSLFLI